MSHIKFQKKNSILNKFLNYLLKLLLHDYFKQKCFNAKQSDQKAKVKTEAYDCQTITLNGQVLS